MTRPGNRLRAFAVRACTADTMGRIIDPVIADIQAEHAQALREGRVWRSRWVRLAGYCAFVKIVSLCALKQAIVRPVEWPSEDRRTLSKTIAFSAAAFVVAMLLLTVPWLIGYPRIGVARPPLWFVWLVGLAPEALPIAIPIAFTVGIVFGLSGQSASRRLLGAVMALGILGSVASFVTEGWVLPATKHSWRIGAQGWDDGQRPTRELTIPELRTKGGSYKQAEMREFPLLAFTAHSRVALSCATLMLAAFLLLTIGQRAVRRGMMLAVACGLLLVYYAMLYWGRMLGLSGELSGPAAAWLPNLSVGLLSLMVFAARHCSLEPAQ